jgi:hypothetical protein
MKYTHARPEKFCPHIEGGCDFAEKFSNAIVCCAPRVIYTACHKGIPAYTEHTQIQRVEFLEVVLRELHHVLKYGDSHDIEDFFHELVEFVPDVAESFTFLLNGIDQVK